MKYLAITIITLTFAFNSWGQCGQKGDFHSLTPKERAQVWKRHYLRQMKDLTYDQREVVYEALEYVTPEHYDDVPEKIDAGDLIERIKANFDREEAQRVFHSLDDENVFLGEVFTLNEGTQCDCSTQYNVLCYRCNAVDPCQETTYGCGPGWVFSCNARCKNE